MSDFNCLRCGTPMHFAGQHRLQLGKTSWLLGDLPNLVAGALDVSIMVCPACGKLEFFPAAYRSPAATTAICTSAPVRPVASATTLTIPNAPSAATSTPWRTNCNE